jgi:sugar O-acyltransferase (sialic acid O-acetyltransferase NeuD family)
MNKPGLIIIGAGGHAHACIDVIEQQGEYAIAGLVGRPEEVGSEHLGYTVITTDNELLQLANDYSYAFIAVGQIKSPESRIRLFRQASTLGFQLPVIVSPSAYVSRHAILGAGTIVMHGAIVNAGVKIGDNCIINTRALIEHGALVEDHCHISTGAILNGDVTVGAGSFVGSGSVIKEGIALGRDCIVGMGLVVRRKQPDKTRFVSR